MRVFPAEPEVDLYSDCFEESDPLCRAVVGKSLSNLVERIEDPLVVALHGGWGVGKSYFLKRWVGAHTQTNNGSATTVYFDAFASDYISDPLPALIAKINDRFPSSDEPTLSKMKAAGFKLAKPLARLGLAITTTGATEVLPTLGDTIVNSLGHEASNGLEAYWSREDTRSAAMYEFRAAITELVARHSNEDQTPERSRPPGAQLVVVIDELDRCRPDYALEVLEVVKHFFSIPGVVFVLGVNLVALENSVKARYGGEIDASAYLRKFINVQLSLPLEIEGELNRENTIDIYLSHNIVAMELPGHVSVRLKEHIKLARRNNDISIRDIGKILSAISLTQGDFLTNDGYLSGWIEVAITLIVSRIIRPDLYPKFLDATIGSLELEEYFDATTLRRTQRIGDEVNAACDFSTWRQYFSWLYLTKNPAFEIENRDDVRTLQNTFSTLGRRRDPNLIPGEVRRKWLDLFSTTNT